MKKSLFLLSSLLFTALCFAQSRQTVAVYTTDASELNIASFVGDFVVNAIVKQGEYSAVERSSLFRSQLASEHAFERSGEVDDKQIAELGKNSGAAYVCVVKIDVAMNKHFVTSRFVNTTTSVVDASARPIFFDSNDITSLEESCKGIVESMLGRPSGAPPRGGSSSSSPSYDGNQSQTYIENTWGINMKFVWVEGGSFLMGCTSEQGGACESDEQNVRRVNVDGFYIGQFEVTQSQWEKVMGTSIYQQRNKANPQWDLKGTGPDYPMYYVSWEEANEFCRILSQQTGKTFMLPTEAQWEYAARGGNKSEGTKYAGSNVIDVVAWYTDNSGGSTHAVGTRRANALGIYDMSGNVWEWCKDWYGSNYANYDTNNPQGPSSGSNRVLRGGSWGYSASNCRVSDRGSRSPGYRNYAPGFRVVLVP